VGSFKTCAFGLWPLFSGDCEGDGLNSSDQTNDWVASTNSGSTRGDLHSDGGAKAAPRRVLTLLDCSCLIVGTIIGAGIFQMPALVAANVPNVFWFLGVWILGGLIALIGALCFAELTTTYPDRGGDYGYLKRAYHHRVGFAFSWAAFWVIRPGNIAAMAMIFGEFAIQVMPQTLSSPAFAKISVLVITATNLLGVTFGKTTQNVLTIAKVLGILVVVVAAMSFSGPAQNASVPGETGATEEVAVVSVEIAEANEPAWNLWLAMVFVMFTFGGWNDISFVATEVQQPEKNLLRSLLLGVLGVLAIYLLVNFALVFSLGFETMASLGADLKNPKNPTSVLVEQNMGARGLKLLAILVCVSCLGAINAMIFTSPRIYWATAQDFPALRWLAGSAEQRSGWWRAMLLQGAVTMLFVVTFGTKGSGIENVVSATAPYFWLFLSLTVIGLMVCRIRYRQQFAGFRVPFYPVLPLIFVAACWFMVYQAWSHTLAQDLWVASLMIGGWVLVGLGFSFALSVAPVVR
jgi:amino acid transporter